MADLTKKPTEMWPQLDGTPCPFCGWMKYAVTLQSWTNTKNVRLLARCSQCGRLRGAVVAREVIRA